MKGIRQSKVPAFALKTASLSANVSAKQFQYSDLGDAAEMPLAAGGHTASLRLTSNGKIQLWLDGAMKEEWT